MKLFLNYFPGKMWTGVKFFPHVTALWNTLPRDITSTPSLSIFKHYTFMGTSISVLSLFLCLCIMHKVS